MDKRDDVVIIGGGAIGLASALALVEAGRSVRVLEAKTVGCGSSHGNCGTITPSHALPLAAPGTVGRALRWLLTPDAPLYLKPRVDPSLWAWLARFASRCNLRDLRASTAAKAEILSFSRQTLPDWIARHGIACEFESSGTDHVFRSAAAFEEFDQEARLLAEFGIASETIDGPTYERSEPAVLPGVHGAVRFGGDASLRPDHYVAGLAHAFRERGGVIVEHCEVQGMGEDDAGIRIAATQGEYRARDVVVAAGAWSPQLEKSLRLGGATLGRAMQPGKGYSITYDRPTLMPAHPLVLHERSVCVTGWGSGFRLGSTMEFSGYDSALNRRRLDALERGSREYLRHPVGTAKREEWFGWRPMTYDDLPIIGRAPGRDHVWYATGHGMLGISMSTGTAQLLADLVCGREPAIDPRPYRAGRFA